MTKSLEACLKLYPDRWLDNTRDLTPKERGAYFDLIALTIERGAPIADDADFLAHSMHVSRRLWQSVRLSLIEKGKIFILDGEIALPGCLTEAVEMPKRTQLSRLAAEIYARQQIPPELRRAVYERDGFACVECVCETHLSCDHAIAVTSGGETTLENLRTLCIPCNIAKGAKNK